MRILMTLIAFALFGAIGTANAADLPSTKDAVGGFAIGEMPAIHKGAFAGAYFGASVNWENLDVDNGATLDWSGCEDKRVRCAFSRLFDVAHETTSVRDSLRGMSDDKITGGVQLGYNWQVGRLYGGPVVKFDLGGPTASLDRTLAGDEEGSISHSLEYSVNWKASILLKGGIQVTDYLGVYALGGVGFVDADVNQALHAGPIPGIGGLGLTSHDNETLTALTYGIGADVKLSDRWRMFAEWQRFDLDTFNSTSSVLIDCLKYNYDGEANLDVVRIGLNYTFN